MKKSVIKTCCEQKISKNYNCWNKTYRFKSANICPFISPPNISPPPPPSKFFVAFHLSSTIIQLYSGQNGPAHGSEPLSSPAPVGQSAGICRELRQEKCTRATFTFPFTVNHRISAALRINAAPRISATPKPTILISAALE